MARFRSLDKIEKSLKKPDINFRYDNGDLHFLCGKDWVIYKLDHDQKSRELYDDTTTRNLLIMGARGSGKSVCCLMKLIKIAYLNPACIDGVKRARFLITRSTYSELLSASLKTLESWFNYQSLKYSINKAAPISARITLYDGINYIEIEFLLISFDRDDSIKKALSLELTASYHNEASTIPIVAIQEVDGSISRFPKLDDRTQGNYIHQNLLDSNAFDKNHPLYYEYVVKPSKLHKFIRQEGGMLETDDGFIENKNADNVRHLPEGYYLNMSHGKSTKFIRSRICNLFIDYSDGKPVFPDFNSSYVLEDIEFKKGSPIFLAHDFGGTNATIIGQVHDGSLYVVKEFISYKESLRYFMSNIIKDYINRNCYGLEVAFNVGDCSNAYSIDSAKNALDIVKESLNLHASPSITNSIPNRISAVEVTIAKQIAGKKALYISHSGCPVLTAGMLGKYVLESVPAVNEFMYKDKPVKNEYSHVADCLQYACLEFNNRRVETKYFGRKIA